MSGFNLLIGLISLAAFVWVAYEVWGVNKRISNGTKVIWTVAALFFSIITAIVYYVVEKRK
ncbi:MAG: PLDc N-terminal domain-containing protein [Phaeodactylibacter sp.]|nr:PLDc N-terminal domain-containing protein [Phaeodactylibacter sp.]MCB9275048.1 PLDc N-terminal domain-containing protein [Lewinellaceae bacterium]